MTFKDRVARQLGPKHPSWIAARVGSDTGPVLATSGHGVHADAELGSVSKALTGQLWHAAVERGEVTTSAVVGDVLPLGGPVAGVTLASLTTHTAGLPRLAGGGEVLRRTWDLLRHGTNPYPEDLAGLLAQSAEVKVADDKKPAYSNLGFQLLGHGLAAAAGTTYRELVAERLCQPLGLAGTYVPYSTADLRPDAITPRNRRGREVDPWASASIAPAGGIRSTATDLAALITSLLAGSAPGMAALDPVMSFSGAVRIGAGWLTMPVKGRTVTWHNGGTGGFRSCLALDREAQTGIAVVSASTRSVDRAALALLADEL